MVGMPQTLIGPTMTGGPARPLLSPPAYACLLKVLSDCGSALTLEDFRNNLQASLTSRLGYRDVTLLAGTLGDETRGALHGASCGDLLPYLAGNHPAVLEQYLRSPGGLTVVGERDEGPRARFGFVLPGRAGKFASEPEVVLVKQLRELLARQVRLLAQLPQPPAWLARLTRREEEVAWLVRDGRTNREIAAMLYVTTETVKKHVKAACSKAEAGNRADLAVRMGGTAAPSYTVVILGTEPFHAFR
jgi:DNA-binding CsgD family transcriptional regulator